MARSQNPMTGKMSGSMGNFVTSSLGSNNIVKTKAFGRRDAKTESQVKQRGGFKMIGELFPMLGSIPHEGFAQRASESSVYAAFMAVNLSGAIDKSGDVAAIDYSKLKVADGTLSFPVVKSATLTEQGITITYLPSLRNQLNFPTDEMVALALTQTGELWIERQPRGSEAQESILIPIEDVTTVDILGVYLFSKRADGSKVSKSVFIPLV
ncbi:MAG: DUF6266 family protein [Paludibacter sp.]